jgi:hypothetical protein
MKVCVEPTLIMTQLGEWKRGSEAKAKRDGLGGTLRFGHNDDGHLLYYSLGVAINLNTIYTCEGLMAPIC